MRPPFPSLSSGTPGPPSETPRISRRGLLTGALGAAAGAAALSGCSSPLASGLVGSKIDPGTVHFWNLFGGGDGARLGAMLDKYRSEHGGPKSLEAATFAWGNPYYTKVTLATLGGQAPDVAISHLTRAKNLARGDLLTELTDDVLALGGLSASDFSATPWKEQKLDGKNYAIPLDTHPFVLYYNVDVCKKAGLMDGDRLAEIKGVDEWEKALTAIKKVTGQYGCSTSTIADTATCWRWFTTLYHQMDGATEFLSDGGRQLTWNNDLALKALSSMQKWARTGLMPKNADYAGAETLMFTGKSGFYLMGGWEITTAQSIKGLNFGMTRIPTLFDKPANQADSHSFVLPKKDRTPDELKRAMGFVKAMLDQSIAWAKGGHVPAYRPALESADFKTMVPQKDYADATDVAVYDPPAWYCGAGSTFENIVGAQIGLVEQDLTTPKQALDTARKQLEAYAKTADPLA